MKLARAETTKRGGQRLLIAFVALSLAITTVYMRESDNGPLHGARRLALAVAAPASKVGMLVTTPLRLVGNGFSGFGATKREVAELRERNQELLATVAQLEEARQQNDRLHALVGFAQRHDLKGLGATIIGRSTDSWEGSIVIDRGARDGVREGMPVLANGGLLGQVVDASGHSARVRLITDQRSGVAAFVQRTRAAGIVRGSIEGRLSLDFVDAKHAPKRSDVIITSGLGGVYPKGLVVGDVTRVDTERGALFPHVTIVSRVAIDRVEEVLVLVGQTGADE